MELSPLVIAVAMLAFFVAGLVKGVIGMGLPTVVAGFVSLVSSPALGAAILQIPSIATNTWQALAGRHFFTLLVRLAPFLVCACAGIWYGTGWLRPDGPGFALAALGGLLALYGIMGLARVHFRVTRRAERWLGPIMGGLTGICAAATGIFLLPGVPFLHSLEMDRHMLVQALGIVFIVSAIAMTVSLTSTGVLSESVALASAAGIVPAVLGMVIGQKIRARISAETFRRWFLIGLVVMGASLAARPLYR